MDRASLRDRGGSWAGLVLLGMVLLTAPIGSAQSLPDLALVDFSTNPERIEPGRPAELIVTIANEGRSMLLRSFQVSIQIGNELVHSGLVSGTLQPSQSIEVSGTWENPTEGEHRVRVRLDPFDRVQESNEDNNELRTTLTVEKPQGIRSFTSPLLDGIAAGLTDAGQALQVEHSADTFKLISTFQSAFDTVEGAYSRSVKTLNAITSTSPEPFQTMPQMAEGERVAQLYGSMASDFETAKTGLAQAQVQALLDAFGNIQSTSQTLATISQPEFDFTPLGETSGLLEETLVEAGKLQDALKGKPNVDVEAATSKLVELLGQMGSIWTAVGTRIQAEREAWSAHITDLDGNPIGRYEAGDPMVISVPPAHSLTLFVYTATGEQVYATGGPRHRLFWRGTTDSGEPLPAGAYYYRLVIGNGIPQPRDELGEFRISAPRED